MVATSQSTAKKADQVPAAKIIKPNATENTAILVSPGVSPRNLEEEVASLRARNKVLTDVLLAIKETAQKEEKRLYDLVWFARNRYRYPNHKSRSRIEQEHKDELEKLLTGAGDYYHGMHAGLLAASRLFKDYADITHINDHEEVTKELLEAAAKHQKKMEESKAAFPRIHVDTPPEEN